MRILSLLTLVLLAATAGAWPPRQAADVRFESRSAGDVRFDMRGGGDGRFDSRAAGDVRFDTRGGNLRFDSRGGGADVRFDVQQRAPARGPLARLLFGGGCR